MIVQEFRHPQARLDFSQKSQNISTLRISKGGLPLVMIKGKFWDFRIFAISEFLGLPNFLSLTRKISQPWLHSKKILPWTRTILVVFAINVFI